MPDSQNRAPSNNEVKAIVKELQNKSKRSFRYSKDLIIKQAQYFSPKYRVFIHKVIANKSLKIVNGYKGGYIEQILKTGESFYSYRKPIEMDENYEIKFDTKLSKKRENRIHTDIRDVTTLPHELGHAVDFMFGRSNTLSNVVLLKNGQTLHQIFTEEFELKHKELYQIVMEEYKNIINSNINDGAYDLLIDHMDEYRLLSSIPIDKNATNKRQRKALQKRLYECKFVDTYYLLLAKKCYQILNDKYSPILDALSSKYDFEGLNLYYHEFDYYSGSKYGPTYEFFANVFAAKVTGRYQHIEYLTKHLPKSLEAFEELFDICYEHIMNDKRFTDVAIRQRSGVNDF